MDREKIIETSYMLDLGSLEENLYSSLLIQFTFICFFTPYLLYAGLISYVINLIVIVLTIQVYTNITRRPISRRLTNIGIWNNLYNVISYVGIVFNAFAISFSWKDLNLVSEDFEAQLPGGRTVSDFVYDVQNMLLIAKFVLSIAIPNLPNSIKMKLNREKLVKERQRKKNSKALYRLAKEKMKLEKKRGGKVKQSSMLEGEEERSLKYFFENDEELKDFQMVLGAVNNQTDDKEIEVKPRVHVRKMKESGRILSDKIDGQ